MVLISLLLLVLGIRWGGMFLVVVGSGSVSIRVSRRRGLGIVVGFDVRISGWWLLLLFVFCCV